MATPPTPYDTPSPYAPPPLASMAQAQQQTRALQQKVPVVARQEAQAVAGNLGQEQAAVDQEAQAETNYQQSYVAPVMEAKEKLAGEQQKAQDALVQANLGLQDKFGVLDKHANALASEPLTDFWADKSTGVKATALLGQMFGGFVQGLYGGDNKVTTAIQQTMERDLQMQRLRHEYGEKGVAQQRGIYSQMMQLFGDRQAAYHASYVTGLEGLSRRLDMNAAKYGNEKVLAAAEKAKAALATAAEPHIEKLKEWGMQQQADLQAHSNSLSASGAQLDQQLILAQMREQAAQELAATKASGVASGSQLRNFTSATPLDKLQARKLQEMDSSGSYVVQGLGELYDMTKHDGGIDAEQIAGPTYSFIFSALRTLMGTGMRLEGKEEQLVELAAGGSQNSARVRSLLASETPDFWARSLKNAQKAAAKYIKTRIENSSKGIKADPGNPYDAALESE